MILLSQFVLFFDVGAIIPATFDFAAKIACIPILATATLPGGAVGTGALLPLAGFSGIVGAPMGGWLTDKVVARFTVVCSGCVSADAHPLRLERNRIRFFKVSIYPYHLWWEHAWF